MLDFLKKFIGKDRREVIINWDETGEKLRDLKAKELEKIGENAEELLAESDNVVAELDDSLDEVRGYEDHQGIEAVEDVAENFYSTRKRLIEDLELSDQPRDHLKDLEEFAAEFENVSRKEEAVMKRVKNEASTLFKSIKRLHDHIDELNEFIEEDYSLVESIRSVEDKVEAIEDTEEKIERLRKEKNSISPEEIKQELEGLQSQMDRLEDSERWREKERTESEIEELKDERSDKISTIERNLSRIQRPLKKIIYNASSGDLEYEGSLERLKKMRDQEVEELDSVEVSEALEVAEKADFVGESQVKKLEDVSEELEDFSEIKNRIEELDEKLEEKQQHLNDLDVVEERRKLLKKLSSKRDELDESKVKRENLGNEIEDLKSERESLIDELESQANELTRHEIEIKEE